MPDLRRWLCQGCFKNREEVGPISWRGLCQTCGRERMNANLDAMESHSGPELHRWRRGMAASVGAVLLDDPGRVE